MQRAVALFFGACFASALGLSVVRAADKEFVYQQSTGKLTQDRKEIGTGYSGNGDGRNNPAKEQEKNIGPIPRGLYKIGKPKEWKGMQNVFDLTPEGHKAHGRTNFLIHGDSKQNPGNASEGCIILPPEVRKKIAESGCARLRVTK